MGLKGPSLHILDVEKHGVQPPGSGNLGVQLPQRAGGGVSGIGEQRLPILLPGLVELGKDCAGHIDLPTDNEPGEGLRQPQGNGADGPQVFCNILPHQTVSPGGSPHEEAVFIFQRHREPVHLGLHGVGHILDHLPDPLIEFGQLLHGEDILEALQRDPVADLLEALRDLSPHPLGGRVRCDPLRMGGLQLLQTAELVVIVIVGHGGGVLDIVLIIGPDQLLAQGL